MYHIISLEIGLTNLKGSLFGGDMDSFYIWMGQVESSVLHDKYHRSYFLTNVSHGLPMM